MGPTAPREEAPLAPAQPRHPWGQTASRRTRPSDFALPDPPQRAKFHRISYTPARRRIRVFVERRGELERKLYFCHFVITAAGRPRLPVPPAACPEGPFARCKKPCSNPSARELPAISVPGSVTCKAADSSWPPAQIGGGFPTFSTLQSVVVGNAFCLCYVMLTRQETKICQAIRYRCEGQRQSAGDLRRSRRYSVDESTLRVSWLGLNGTLKVVQQARVVNVSEGGNRGRASPALALLASRIGLGGYQASTPGRRHRQTLPAGRIQVRGRDRVRQRVALAGARRSNTGAHPALRSSRLASPRRTLICGRASVPVATRYIEWLSCKRDNGLRRIFDSLRPNPESFDFAEAKLNARARFERRYGQFHLESRTARRRQQCRRDLNGGSVKHRQFARARRFKARLLAPVFRWADPASGMSASIRWQGLFRKLPFASAV